MGYSVKFVQDNESLSSKGVLRGLHYQLSPHAQSKLVRVIEGEVLDIAVDIRVGSDTFGQHVSVVLSGENKKQILSLEGSRTGSLYCRNRRSLPTKLIIITVQNVIEALPLTPLL